MFKFLKILIALLLISTLINASETGGLFELGIKGGVSSYWGEIGGSKIKPAGGGSVYWWANDYMAVGLDGGVALLEADKGTKYFQSTVYNLGPTLKLKPFPQNDLNLVLIGGFVFLNIDPKGKDDFSLPNLKAGKYNKNHYAATTGIGISPFLYDEVLSLDLQAVYYHATTDYLDDLAKGDWRDGFMTFSAGLSVYLGEPKDTDLDGIPDKYDADPLHKEDIDGFQDSDGAPDLDNDQDGIPDAVDELPLEPEDRDGFQDSDGKPDLDNDNDGIEDLHDQAPNEPEDIDGFQDEDGKPDPDNDSDGIADVNDNCPDDAETINGYEDEDGCPDVKPEIDVEAGASLVLEGVNFASGSTELTAASLVILDKVVRTMSQNKNIEIEIRGYTDNTGSYEGNVNLSKRRANAVKDYLIYQGIESFRIQTKGFGPEDPIAPNNTREGRAKNRRIEFFRIK